ncbi:MAG TPA: hypothetical protein VGP93_04905, partial [Polyangiaceae bacterium]|nr:hypothetical protein [Polyangiaceae bacterium]
MEWLVAHLASARRLVPHVLPVVHVGYLSQKSGWNDWLFHDVVFLFVLSGSGSVFVDDGPEIELKGPCVLCAIPGKTYRYGPKRTWEELFVKY